MIHKRVVRVISACVALLLLIQLYPAYPTQRTGLQVFAEAGDAGEHSTTTDADSNNPADADSEGLPDEVSNDEGTEDPGNGTDEPDAGQDGSDSGGSDEGQEDDGADGDGDGDGTDGEDGQEEEEEQEETPPVPPADKLTEYSWEKVTSNIMPSARQGAAMAFDELNQKVIMFGGEGSTALLRDNFMWDGAEKKWSKLADSSVPSGMVARRGAAIAYDPISMRVLLFGGQGASGVLGDLWAWNGTNLAWERLNIPVPTPRAGSQMAFDGKQLVLFGGYELSGGSRVRLGDTWILTATGWEEAEPETSPPPTYYGAMAFDGKSAVLYGGNIGEETRNDSAYQVNSNQLWIWNGTTWDGSTVTPEPKDWGRWGHIMGYDGRRVVFYGGAFDWVNPGSSTIVAGKTRPIANPADMNGNRAVIGWERWNSSWAEWLTQGVSRGPGGGVKDGPGSGSYMSMAFDGEQFVVFGGFHEWGGLTNDTFRFGNELPVLPTVTLTGQPFISMDKTDKTKDLVRITATVTGKAFEEVGIEYREVGQTEWQIMLDPDNEAGALTLDLKGLKWQAHYEGRVFATNVVGTARSQNFTFQFYEDPAMVVADLRYDRSSPSVLHADDKKRMLIVGQGITNLWRKPADQINYSLKGKDGKVYPLTTKVRNDLELEVIWTDDLPDGKYDLDLKHAFYEDFAMEDALLITSSGVYEPRDYNEIVVPASDPENEDIDKLTISGPFTELPGELGVFRLNNPKHVVLLNQYIKFKGSEFVVDKRGEDTVVSGNGMLYVEQSGIMYSLLSGEFEFDSDEFSIELHNPGSEYDFLNLNMPVTLSSISFVSGGIRLGGEIKVNFTAGTTKIKGESEIEALQFRRDRFDFAGTFNLEGNFETGPLESAELRFRLDTRVPLFGAGGSFDLRKQKVGFEADILFRQGKLDALSFGVRRKIKLGNTGAQITRLGGGFSGLASQQEVPFTLKAFGGASDVIAPEIKDHNMVNGNNLSVGLSRYHFQSSGELYIYWVPVAKLDFLTIWDPSGFKGINGAGFRLNANLNLIDIVVGELFAQYFTHIGYSGFVSARVQIPRWVSVIGGKSFGGIDVGVNNQQIFGSVGSGWFGGSAKYMFKPNKFDFSLGASKDMKKEIERMKKNMVKTPAALSLMGIHSATSRLSAAALLAPLANPLEKVDNGYDLKLQNSIVQQGDIGVSHNVKTAISAGQFTAVLRENAAEATFPDEQTIQYEWKADRAYEALLVLEGQANGVSIKQPNGTVAPLHYENGEKAPARSLLAVYDAASGKTFIRIAMKKDETWKLASSTARLFEVYELTFLHEELALNVLASEWTKASDLAVTAVRLENRGQSIIELDEPKGELKLFKPDGREYNLEADSALPSWNRFVDGGSDKLVLVVDVAEPGEWLLDSGEPAEVKISSTGSFLTTASIKNALQNGRMSTEIAISAGQTLLEIENASGSEVLYRPDGTPYSMQTFASAAGWNARFEADKNKWSILIEATKEEQGAWKVEGSEFVTLRAFRSPMKYADLTPFFSDGQAEYTTSLQIDEPGRYMFMIEGGDAGTKLRGPSGQLLPMVFEDADAEDFNAVLQPALRYSEGNEDYGDITFTSNMPIVGDKDMLYVAADLKTAGKVQIVSSAPVEASLYELDQVTKIESFTAQPVTGAANTYKVKWKVNHAKPGTEVKLMLTEQSGKAIGFVLAEGLPSSGIQTVAVPEGFMPGDYWFAMVAEGEDVAPLFAVTEDSIQLQAAVMLPQPQQVEIVSTGNRELTLQFLGSDAPELEFYQIKVSFLDKDGEKTEEIFGVDPKEGTLQTVIISGYESGFTYTLEVMSVGNANGKTVVSPVSQSVEAYLPEPSSADIQLTFETGNAKQVSGTYKSYDNYEENMTVTAGEWVAAEVSSDQDAELDLYINGELAQTMIVAEGGKASFDLNALLGMEALEQRDYTIQIEAVNENGDYSTAYSKLYIDRTAPFLYAAGQIDGEGPERMPLSGQAVYGSRLPIIGQTDIGAELTIDGRVVPLNADGRFQYFAPIEWNGGTAHTVVAIVSDQVGNYAEYRFEVVKGTEDEEDSVIDATSLAGLELSNGYLSESFSPDREEAYEATVEDGKFRLYAVPAAADSVVTIDGRPLESGGYLEMTAPSPNTIRGVLIKVTAKDGSSRTHEVNISSILSNVAVLKTMTIKAGEDELLAEPGFNGATTDYTAYAEFAQSRIHVNATAYKQGSAIYVNNMLASGAMPIDLAVGDNVVNVRVESPDGKEKRVYRILVTREGDSNASLASLALQGGQLTREFESSELEYSVVAPSDATELIVSAQAASPYAKVSIAGNPANGSQAQSSIVLRGGSQTARVKVTAQDGTETEYKLQVYKGTAPAAAAPYLSDLKVSGLKLASAFSSSQLSYAAEQRVSASSVSVTADTLEEDTRLTINGAAVKKGQAKTVALRSGSNLIVIGVESADRSTSRQYSVYVEASINSEEVVNKRPADVISGDKGGLIANVDIVRDRLEDGKLRDKVSISAEKAKEIAEQSKKAGQTLVSIVVTDPKEPGLPADETTLSVDKEAVALLSDSGITLQIVTPTASLTLAPGTLAGIKTAGTELYFRIVPIRDVSEQDDVRRHLIAASPLKEQLAGRSAEVVGVPATIETNYKSGATTIVLPLSGLSAKAGTPEARILANELAVYIQHSDGEQVLTKGTLQYNAEGLVNGVTFEVSKFSVFSLVRLTGEKTYKPYINGYPDGTFRPDKTITRAELASILAKELMNIADAADAAADTQSPSAAAIPSATGAAYNDVPANYWAADAIKLLQSHGIMKGDGQGFRPEAGVTRAEMAMIAARWSGLGEVADVAFEDTAGHWAQGAVSAVQKAGLMQGYPDDTFRPSRLLLRGEAVRVLNGVFKRPVPQANPATGWRDVSSSHWAKRDIEAASGYVREMPDGQLDYAEALN